MIDCTIKGRIGIITLKRPEKLNAINREMFESIDQHLTLWEKVQRWMRLFIAQ